MEYIRIGTIVNTHGIRGELKIQSCSDFDSIRYRRGNTVYIGTEGSVQPFKVDTYRSHKGMALVSLQGYRDINLVEGYVGQDVFVLDTDRAPLKKGEYYRSDLVGLAVKDEQGNDRGTVLAVEETMGAQNNLRIRTLSGKEILVPYIPAFIRKIDMDEKTVTAVWMEGLE